MRLIKSLHIQFLTISYSIQLPGRPYTHLTMQSKIDSPMERTKDANGIQRNCRKIGLSTQDPANWVSVLLFYIAGFIVVATQDCNRFQSCTQGKHRLVKGKVVSFTQEPQEMNRLPGYSHTLITHTHTLHLQHTTWLIPPLPLRICPFTRGAHNSSVPTTWSIRVSPPSYNKTLMLVTYTYLNISARYG